jgi:hypothetical protein
MSETATQAPPAAPAQTVALVGHRERKETGMPKSGIVVLVGNPKSGKTWLASSISDSYVLELEKGGGDRVPGRIHDIANLGEFRQVLKAVMAEPSVKTVVIDTIDVLSDWLEDEIATSYGLESITERKSGVDSFQLWGELRKRIEGLVGYFEASNKLVVLLAHCKEPKIDTNGNIVIPAGINIPGKSGAYIAARAKVIGHCYKKDNGQANGYFITFRGGPLGVWGSRVEELNDKTITLPKDAPWQAIEAVFKTPAAQPAQVKTVEAKAAPKGVKK